jgi:hypothetical protein
MRRLTEGCPTPNSFAAPLKLRCSAALNAHLIEIGLTAVGFAFLLGNGLVPGMAMLFHVGSTETGRFRDSGGDELELCVVLKTARVRFPTRRHLTQLIRDWSEAMVDNSQTI